MNIHAPIRKRQSPVFAERDFPLFCAVVIVLVVALTVGGASRVNPIQVTVVELVSLPLLIMALLAMQARGLWSTVRIPLALIGFAALIPLVQLAPLPPGLWAGLPGHQPVADALGLAGIAPHWRSITLAPAETLGSLLALIPPVAVFFATFALPSRFRRWSAGAIVLVALASTVLGACQVSGYSNLDLYGRGDGMATGFFANRNHQAAFLVCVIPLIAYLTAGEQTDFGALRRGPRMALAMAGVMVLVAGLVIVKSRAGVLLLAPCLVASLLLVWRAERDEDNRRLGVLIAGVAGMAMIAAVLAMGPLLDRFASVGLADAQRAHISLTVAKLGLHYLPIGSGIGSFVPIFAGAEPLSGMGDAFWNHAHNEYVETWLEAGVMGVLLIAAFIAWWAMRALRVWTASPSRSILAASAGATIVALMLVHSTVDYPLRTLAMACVFAYGCALLCGSSSSAGREKS